MYFGIGFVLLRTVGLEKGRLILCELTNVFPEHIHINSDTISPMHDGRV